MCVVANFAVGNIQKPEPQVEGKLWVGVGYLAAEAGYSNGSVAAIGVGGVAHAAMEGAIWGAVFGSGVGAVAGAVAGL